MFHDDKTREVLRLYLRMCQFGQGPCARAYSKSPLRCENKSRQSNCTSCAPIAPLLLLDISKRYNELVEVLEEIVVVVNLNVSAVLLLAYDTARSIM